MKSHSNWGLIIPGMLSLHLISPPAPEKTGVKDVRSREIRLLVAASPGIRRTDGWRLACRRAIFRLNIISRSHFGISLRPSGFKDWDLDPGPVSNFDLIEDLNRKFSPRRGEIRVGLVPGRPGGGCADYYRACILIRAEGFDELFRTVLLHELGHIFGAVDIRDKGSIMNPDRPGKKIDEFTRSLIRAHRHRGFNSTDFPLDDPELAVVTRLLEKRSSSHPGETGALIALAGHYRRRRNPAAGLKALRKARALDPGRLDIAPLTGLILLELGSFESAAREFRMALESRAWDPGLHFNLGQALNGAGRLGPAMDAYRAALSLRPDFTAASINLAALEMRRERFEQAVHWGRRALTDPEPPAKAFLVLAAALISGRMHRKNDGRPRDPNPQETVGHGPLVSGNDLRLPASVRVITSGHPDLREAAALCRRAASLRPDLPDAYNLLGVALALSGDSGRAEAALLTSLRLNPGFEPARRNLALLRSRRRGFIEGHEFNRAGPRSRGGFQGF